jgi:hypothetical protein
MNHLPCYIYPSYPDYSLDIPIIYNNTYIQPIIVILWLFNIAMENGTSIDGLPIKNGDLPWLC